MTKALAPKIQVTQHDVEAFVRACVKLRSHYEHYNTLFRRGLLRLQLLEKVAHVFFHDLNDIFIRAIIGDVCRLTDPPQTAGRENLTIKLLADGSNFANKTRERSRIDALTMSIHQFRDRLVEARNKRIAHHDRTVATNQIDLGAAPYEAWDQFWLDLQEFVNIFHTRYIDPNGHFQLNGIASLTDAEMLVKALRESTYFNELVTESALSVRCANVAFGSAFSEA